MLISSQRYIDNDIVAGKIANEDFEVLVSPEFEIDGERYQVVLDGHHSYAAAVESGNDAVFEIATASTNDSIAVLENLGADDFLDVVHMGDDYYDIETGDDVF